MILPVQTAKHREFVKFCNSLRCPLCQSQLDGSIFSVQANLYCVVNNQEYVCSWIPNEKDPQKEIIRYWYPQYEYEIVIHKINDKFNTSINRYNRDVTALHKNSTRKVMFNFSGSRILFFRKRMEEQDFLNKLNTYNIFS
jgi:hypothetical protein